jgi:hypothetical protein
MKSLTIEKICREMLIGREVSSENKLPQMFQLAINGLREFNMDINPSGGSAAFTMLKVHHNQTCDLPHNYIDYIRIGILDHHGEFKALGINNNIRYSNPVDACGNPILPCADREVSSQEGINSIFALGGFNWDGLADNIRNNEVVGRFFGKGGGQNDHGYYRVNLKSGKIELGACHAKEIALEYLADPEMIDGEFHVHPYLVQALKAWIRYEELVENVKVPLGLLEMRRTEKYNEMRLAVARFNMPVMTELIAAMQKGNKMSPKF